MAKGMLPTFPLTEVVEKCEWAREAHNTLLYARHVRMKSYQTVQAAVTVSEVCRDPTCYAVAAAVTFELQVALQGCKSIYNILTYILIPPVLLLTEADLQRALSHQQQQQQHRQQDRLPP